MILGTAFAGTAVIASVSVAIYQDRSDPAKQRGAPSGVVKAISRVSPQAPAAAGGGQSKLPPVPAAESPGPTPPPISDPSQKGGQTPVPHSGSSVSITSTVTNEAGRVQVSGTASPGAKVTVNGRPVDVHPDGTWSVGLTVGRRPTTVSAISADGHSRSTASVTVG